MDAKHAPQWALACAVIFIGGCLWNLPPPTARQPAPTPKREDPPQVVQLAPASQPTPENRTDDLSATVLGWVNRVDGAQRRAPQREEWRPDPRQAVRQAVDVVALPATQPAARPNPVVIKPERVAVPSTPEPAVVESPAPTPTTQASPAPPESAQPPATQPGPPAPPVLTGVTVRAAPIPPTTGGEPFAPGVNAPAVARGAAQSLADFLKQTPAIGDDSFTKQIDQRMLWAIAGDYEHAREPLKLVTAEQQEIATRFIDAWIAIREGHMGDLAGAASAASGQLAELQDALRRLSELSIPAPKVCSTVRGYGQYDVIEPARFTAGSAAEFVLYCEVRDFVSERRDDGQYYTTFDMTTTLLNRAGENVLELKDVDLVDRCQNRRHDCFIPRLVRLPATLSPGQYVAKVTVADKLGQKVAENRVTFQVAARP